MVILLSILAAAAVAAWFAFDYLIDRASQSEEWWR